MPLKHTTETFLLFLLGVMTVVTGVLLRSLPGFPEALLPWGVLLVISIVYRLLVAPLFRRNRADNFFRNIHWVPAIMLVLWAALAGFTNYNAGAEPILYWYTWGWSLPIVTTAFIFFLVFTMKVLRRWQQRLVLLAAAFVPFMVGGILGENKDWNSQVTAALWEHEIWQVSESQSSVSVIVAQSSSSSVASEAMTSKNLEASEDPAEEGYRERLRSIERRRERIANRLKEWDEQSSASSQVVAIEEGVDPSEGSFFDKMMAAFRGDESSASSVVAIEDSSASSHPLKTVMGQALSHPNAKYAQTSSKPSTLPDSGFNWLLIILCGLGLYSANVHHKTVQRSQLS